MHLLGLESGLRGGEGGNFFLESPLSIKMHLPGLGGNDEAARIQCVGVSGHQLPLALVWIQTYDLFGHLKTV